MQKTTEELKNELKDIESSNQFEDWLETALKGSTTFEEYFRKICEEKGITRGQLVNRVAMGRSYLYEISDGKKHASKETIIKIALGLEATVEETNMLLKASGNQELYPRKEQDAIIEFGIRNHWSVYQIDELLEKRGLSLRLTE